MGNGTGEKLRLYHYWRSSASWRVRWALAIKNVPCEMIAVNLLTDESDQPEHRARNPMGYVPVLEVGTKDLCESIAIIEWLEEIYPTPTLFSGDALQRARIRQLAQLINSGIQPLQNPPVYERVTQDPIEQRKWNQHWIEKGLGSYEQLVQETAGKLSFGNTVTVADLCLIPQCYTALRNEVALETFPTVQRIYQYALGLETCKASAPERYQPR